MIPVVSRRLAELAKAIATRINAEFEHAQFLRKHLAQELLALEMLPATLLREAFSGQV